MGVILQATYRLPGGRTVPSPADGSDTTPWWWDHLAGQANAFRQAGFTAILLPPTLKTNAGTHPGADGYGPFDDYDLGSKDQCGGVPTRFGTREQLQRCTAMMRANGLDVYLDIVLHHRNGGNGFVYRYDGANGVAGIGRFPKNPECFLPNVPRDPIAGPVADDFGFGDELAPVNARPKGYVRKGLIDAVDWQTRALDAQGYRLDDTKGLAVSFVRDLLDAKAMRGKFAVGEYYDGNPDTLNWWVWNSGMNGRASTFDFGVRYALTEMCNQGSRWNMARLEQLAFTARDPMHAVSFIENHDTDLKSPAIWNKLLGYAYLLTSEGYPCIYYKDYSTDRDCYGLKEPLDNLIWIHENLAEGETQFRAKEYQYVVYERMGGAHLLVGLNNDLYNGWKSVKVATDFGPNVQLHDYTGHAGDVWTGADGTATIGIPQNDNGRGYVCYSRAGLEQPNRVARLATTQVFEGAADLDIGAAIGGHTVVVGRIWCDAGREVILRQELGGPGLEFAFKGPTGSAVALKHGKGRTAARGWHTIEATSTAAGQTPFRLAITYTSTQSF